MIPLSTNEDVDNSSSNLLAWCSLGNNNIKVAELGGKQEEYADFEGVQLFSGSNNRYQALSN